MHAGKLTDDEPMAEMNLIPLIDIALTLLIIMMVTTAFVKNPGVALKLPETVTREGAPESNKDLTINVTAEGGIYFDGNRRTQEEVQQRLRTIAQTKRDARVLVKGDRDVAYAHIMEVMDLVRQAGLTRVVLPTDPKNARQTPEPPPSLAMRASAAPAP